MDAESGPDMTIATESRWVVTLSSWSERLPLVRLSDAPGWSVGPAESWQP
jgi:hypothetical protein